jgi:hypothetical protein
MPNAGRHELSLCALYCLKIAYFTPKTEQTLASCHLLFDLVAHIYSTSLSFNECRARFPILHSQKTCRSESKVPDSTLGTLPLLCFRNCTLFIGYLFVCATITSLCLVAHLVRATEASH